MALKFVCNQDIKKMENINGNLFCKVCKKDVYDVRGWKTNDIIRLKEKKGTCCVTMSKNQQLEFDRRLQRKGLPFVYTGVMAIFLFPLSLISQNDSSWKFPIHYQEQKDASGNSSLKWAEKKITFRGKVKNTSKGSNAHVRLVFGYYTYDSLVGKLFYQYAEVITNKRGRFKFSLSEDELTVLQSQNPTFKTEDYEVKSVFLDLNRPKRRIKIETKQKPVHLYDTGII